MKITINLEETIELIEMHGRTIVDVSMCDECMTPIKEVMLGKLDRMRQLIETLPDHIEKPEQERLQ